MDSTSSPLEHSLLQSLADAIQANCKLLSDSLSGAGLPPPSLGVDGPTNVVPPTAPTAAKDARDAVVEAAFKLFHLVTGPSELLPNFVANYQTLYALRWLLHFGICDLVPIDGSLPYNVVAAKANVPEPQLKSVVRMAMTSYVLCEPEPNRLAHTASSAMFVKNRNMVHWAQYMFQASIPTAASLVEATEKWPGSLKRNETAYNIAFSHDLPFFDHVSQSPVLTEQFSGYMNSKTDVRGTDLTHLLNGFDWASLPLGSLVVDIGGSTGHATFALAEAFPNVRFEIQDLESVAKKATELLEARPEAISTRVSVRPHDFFQPQPVQGANVYLLRTIIHNWPDAESIKILSNVAPCLGPKSVILLMDTVIPVPGEIPVTKERTLRARDLVMTQTFNSRERSVDDWEGLLGQVDPQLKLLRVHRPEDSDLSLLTVGF